MPRRGYTGVRRSGNFRSVEKSKKESLKRLVEAAYVKGVFDALIGNGSVFVSGLGLVSGLLPENLSLLEEELIRNAKNRQEYYDRKLVDSLPDGSVPHNTAEK